MLLSNKVEESYTVEDFIELGKDIDDVQYCKYSILSKATTDTKTPLLYAEHNVIYDYEYEFKKLSQDIIMTDNEFNKYIFKPKLLSYDLYGSTELYFVILYLNNMCSIKDFNRKEIKLIRKSSMIDLLEEIYNAESRYIRKNRSSVGYID